MSCSRYNFQRIRWQIAGQFFKPFNVNTTNVICAKSAQRVHASYGVEIVASIIG